MAPITRRLFNLLTVLSLLASVAVVALWVRSHFARDMLVKASLAFVPNGHRAGSYMLHTWERVLTLDAVQHDLTRGAVPAREYAAHLDLARAEHRVAGEWTWMTQPPAEFPARQDGPLARYGFAGSTVNDTGPGHRRVRIGWSVPFWFALVLVSLPLDVLTIRRLRRRWLRRALRCLTCGYDLRATPDRCPECGTMAPSQAST